MRKINGDIWRYIIVGASIVAGYAVLTYTVQQMKPAVEANTTHRIQAEIETPIIKEDIKEIKEDVKEILREVRK